MNILVTGATGFIGSHLVESLMGLGHTVFCTLREGSRNPFGEYQVKSIVINESGLNDAIDFFRKHEIDGVVHLAAYAHTGEHSHEDVVQLIESNITFGTLLMEVAACTNVKWMINTGTCWQNWNGEEYSPVNLYAATKQAFEDIAKLYWETTDIKFCTLRLFDTYGAKDPRRKVFSLWYKIAETGELLDMSPGDQVVDFSYIDDVIYAYLKLINLLHEDSAKIKSGDIFHLKSPERVSLKELAMIFEEVTKKKLNIRWGGRPYRKREIIDPYDKVQLIPDFEHRVSIADGIKHLI